MFISSMPLTLQYLDITLFLSSESGRIGHWIKRIHRTIASTVLFLLIVLLTNYWALVVTAG